MVQVKIQSVPEQPVAVVKGRANLSELAAKLPPMCGQAWEFIRSRPDIKSNGHMIAIYRGDPLTGMDIEAGAQVDAAFQSNGPVVSSSTPAGLVATAAHVGPYSKMGETHDAIRRWCAENGRAITDLAWEVYDHPVDDPSKLRTDIYYQLT